MRRAINLVLALALTTAGSYGLIYLLFFAAWWKGWMIMSAAFMFGLGLMWLWSDYIDATPNEIKDRAPPP